MMYAPILFFFNDTATTEIYTLSLHDALPIFGVGHVVALLGEVRRHVPAGLAAATGEEDAHGPSYRGSVGRSPSRSEEHTSELQSRQYLVCRLLLEKKKNTRYNQTRRIQLSTT